MDATSSISARAATISDHGHYAAMLPELGVDDPILEPARWSAELMPGTLLFEENGVVVGYAWIVPMGDVAYVRHVVVAKNARGRGVGRFIMREIARRMRAAGCTDWVLNVKVDNVPAIRLYSSIGFEKEYDSASMRLAWDVVEHLPSEAGYSARLIERREDELVERAFNLLKNRIANVRLQNGWILMRLEDPMNPDDYGIGFTCFQPQFPGCFPFASPDQTSLACCSMQLARMPCQRSTTSTSSWKMMRVSNDSS
ncbi:MAG: GNAT family N-acetyltransferase [Polyangiaceae bacterium]|nr:GNAT family N-acetyltransferase [Polyangiaceae bacterium]